MFVVLAAFFKVWEFSPSLQRPHGGSFMRQQIAFICSQVYNEINAGTLETAQCLKHWQFKDKYMNSNTAKSHKTWA